MKTVEVLLIFKFILTCIERLINQIIKMLKKKLIIIIVNQITGQESELHCDLSVELCWVGSCQGSYQRVRLAVC